MNSQIKINVKCPKCDESLMNSQFIIDDLPSIDLQAKILDKVGHLYLSQIYGSYTKEFVGVDNINGAIVEISCPKCYNAFPVQGICECKAPIVGFTMKIGGIIKVCTRNGCKKHSLEFEDANAAFGLFKSQDSSGLG